MLEQQNYIEIAVTVLIVLFPFCIATLISKQYNIFHGIITYLFFSFIIYFFFNELSNEVTMFSVKQCELIINAFYIQYYFVTSTILLIPNMKDLIISNEKYITITIVFVVYLITHIISMIIKKIKIE